MHDEIKILDGGYVRLVECWGHGDAGLDRRICGDDNECGIIEAARQSTQGSFRGWEDKPCPECKGSGSHWVDPVTPVDCEKCKGKRRLPGDARLLATLFDHKPPHATPFEFAGCVIEVQAPIFVFREWHRHRTQCLAPDTRIYFDMPSAVGNGRRRIYTQTIEELYRKWQPTIRGLRPERQVNALHPRSLIKNMHLRCLNEESKEFTHSSIVDVIKGERKHMVEIVTASGRTITATLDHKFHTNEGWVQLRTAIERKLLLTTEGCTREKSQAWEIETSLFDSIKEEWRPVYRWENYYQVSSMGNVRRRGKRNKKRTIGKHGYYVVSLNRPGYQETLTVHTLVLQAFRGLPKAGEEARHLNHNRLDIRLSNLEWGSAKQNHADMIEADRHQRLVPRYEEIVSVKDVGLRQSYDLTVQEPWHNFVANGFVVHNSYNEMSARYSPLPNNNYVPTAERCLVVNGRNKQANAMEGAEDLTHASALAWLEQLAVTYEVCERTYQLGLRLGIPKELARLCVPVGRYSRMRAATNLRNWLAFVTLRAHPDAQWEIRQYAEAVAMVLSKQFPRTWKLFEAARG